MLTLNPVLVCEHKRFTTFIEMDGEKWTTLASKTALFLFHGVTFIQPRRDEKPSESMLLLTVMVILL